MIHPRYSSTLVVMESVCIGGEASKRDLIATLASPLQLTVETVRSFLLPCMDKAHVCKKKASLNT